MLIRQTDNTLQSRTLSNISQRYYGIPDIKNLQVHLGVEADGVFGPQTYKALYADLLDVVDMTKSFSDYIKVSHPKKQIIWHHAAGWDNARGMIDYWQMDSRPGVATSTGINDDGKIYKAFDEQFWGGSIGCDAKVFIQHGIPLIRNNKGNIINNALLDQGAVAVEVCNWGCLTEKNGKKLSWANVEVPENKVIALDYKSFKFFERYTNDEIETLKRWTLLNALRFNIPLDYSEDDMWQVSKKALSGQPGLYTHNSYRWDKNDVSPQPALIEMAKTLKSYQV